MFALTLLLLLLLSSSCAQETLIFEDTFTTFNFSLWKHELTLNGDMNWAFEE